MSWCATTMQGASIFESRDWRVEMDQKVEPWLRGTRDDLDALRRGVIHALELAAEDVTTWCKGLDDREMELRPMGLPPVGFHLRHVARSLDRLLTYAEGQQ